MANNYGLRNYTHPDKFGQWLGYEATFDREKRTAVAKLTVREDHLSPAGRVHGGVVSALFDFACGAAIFATLEPDDFTSTVELKVNYLRPIEMGDLLTARTEVVFRGKRLGVVTGKLFKDGTDEPVAIATATFNIVSGKSAPTSTTASGPGTAS